MSDLDRDPLHDQAMPWRRWRMDELAPPRRQVAPARKADDPEEARRSEERRRQAELEALREETRKAAREEGHREGLAAGHAEGYAEGLEAGREAGRLEMESRLRETVAPLLPLAQQFEEALSRLDEEVAADLVDLALATGRQLAGEALKARPRQVLEIVRALLHTEPAMHGKPRLWLHPRDHDLVVQHLGQELEAAGWRLQPDDQVSRGGCRVTSASGELDATWESRWEAVRGQVRRRRPGEASEPSPKVDHS